VNREVSSSQLTQHTAKHHLVMDLRSLSVRVTRWAEENTNVLVRPALTPSLMGSRKRTGVKVGHCI